MSNQIAVDLIARDMSLSSGLTSGITNIDRYNAAAQRIQPIKLTAEIASFHQAKAELWAIRAEREAILARGSMDYTRHAKTPDQLAAQQTARDAQDIAEAAKRANEAMRFQDWNPEDRARQWFKYVEIAESANDRVRAGFQKLNHDLAVEARRGMSQLEEMPAADARKFFERVNSGKTRDDDLKALQQSQKFDDDVTRQYVENRKRMAQADAQKVADAEAAYRRQVEFVQKHGIKRMSIDQWRASGSVEKQNLQEIETQVARNGRVAMQAAFAMDDFFAGYHTGGLMGGLRGVQNNLSMIAMELGGVKAMMWTIGVTAGVSLAVAAWKAWTNSAKEARDVVAETNQQLEAMRLTMHSIEGPQGRSKTLAEIKRGMDRQDPADLRSRLADVQHEGQQRVTNQRLIAENAAMVRARFESLGTQLTKSLIDPTANPYVHDPRSNKLDSLTVMSHQLQRADLTDEQRGQLRSLIELQQELNRIDGEYAENLTRVNDLRRERQAINSMLPAAEANAAEEAAKIGREQLDRENKDRVRMQKQVRGELLQQERQLTKEQRLDMIVTQETDPRRGIILEMKERLDLARQIADKEERSALIASIKEAALLKLAKDQVSGQAETTNTDRDVLGTVIGNTREAWRTIQTATNQARQTPEQKHLPAIERLNVEQRDLLRELVEQGAQADPIAVVGNQ